jgi:hypothetical protein
MAKEILHFPSLHSHKAEPTKHPRALRADPKPKTLRVQVSDATPDPRTVSVQVSSETIRIPAIGYVKLDTVSVLLAQEKRGGL